MNSVTQEFFLPDGKLNYQAMSTQLREADDAFINELFLAAGFEETRVFAIAILRAFNNQQDINFNQRKAMFGKSSEKAEKLPEQGELFGDEKEKEELRELEETLGRRIIATIDVKTHSRNIFENTTDKKEEEKREYLASHLPVEDTKVYEPELDPNVEYVALPDKVAEEIDIVPAHLFKRLIIRKQYRPKEADEHGNFPVVTAELPRRPIDRVKASSGFLSYITCMHLLMAMPWYRLSRHFLWMGYDVSRTLLYRYSYKMIGIYLTPVKKLMLEDLRKHDFVMMDETKCLNLENRRENGTQNSTIVAARTGPHSSQQIVIYEYRDDKKKRLVTDLLGEDYKGTIQTDGYPKSLDSPDIILAGCHAHNKRRLHKVLDPMPAYKEYEKIKDKKERLKYRNKSRSTLFQLSMMAMEYYGYLYTVESHLDKLHVSLKTRKMVRQSVSKRLLGILDMFIMELKDGVPHVEAVQDFCDYYTDNKEKLWLMIDNPKVRIDNNLSEQLCRAWAIFRDPTLFNITREAARRCCDGLSVLKSCELNNVNPQKYLTWLIDELKGLRDYNDKIDEKILREYLPYSKTLPAELYLFGDGYDNN